MSLQFLSSFASSLHRAHQTGRSRPSYNLPDRFTVKTSAYHQTVSKGNIETLALQSRCCTTGDRVVSDKSSVDTWSPRLRLGIVQRETGNYISQHVSATTKATFGQNQILNNTPGLTTSITRSHHKQINPDHRQHASTSDDQRRCLENPGRTGEKWGDMSSGGFAARAQAAGDRNANASGNGNGGTKTDAGAGAGGKK